MLWSEIKRCAKQHGYEAKKNNDGYSWVHIDDSSKNGISKSVSKLAKAIFNNMTNDAFVDHQNNYVSDIKIQS
jgi:hypothetical protein